MKNVTKQLVNAWFDLLDGNLTYNSRTVKVYKEDSPNTEDYHHVLIRAESETDDSNKQLFVTVPVIIIDIITLHDVSVKRSIVDDIDNQIRELIFPTRRHGLTDPTDLQIVKVIPSSSMYLPDDDGVKRIYRKITRYSHSILETTI